MRSVRSKLLVGMSALLLLGSMAVAFPNDQQALSDQVRKELATLPYYGVFDNLAYQINGGTVTLSGQVVKPVTKSDAAHRVAKIAGVQQVVNNIEVLPLSPMDNGLRIRTYQAIFRTDGLYRYAMGAIPSIHIIVDNGHVTLVGVVSSKQDSELASMAANRVPGVFSVKNNLQIEGAK